MSDTASILWRRLDQPGHEWARVWSVADGWRIEGCAVFGHGGEPARLDYQIACSETWQTVSAAVVGWVGSTPVDVEIAVTPEHRWTVNGKPLADVDGCVDVDLNFSPSTNLLPIRRLDLHVGQEATVRAAWLRFPSFRLEVLEQTYRRVAADVYDYESGGGRFKSQLRVNAFGLPVDYRDVWTAEAST